MGFLSQLFVNPQLLGLAALVGVPIVIYLINRHRYRRRKWAAMEFLLRALRKSQRRLQIQNLLLLAIRCLIILLLVLAVARPVLDRSPFLAEQSGRNWIFALDTSFSMDFREGPRSVFDEARETLVALFEDGLLQKVDHVAVMTLADDPRVLLSKTPATHEARVRLERELKDLEISHRSVDVVSSLRLLDALSREFVSPVGDFEPVQVVFFSDLQRKDWVLEDRPISIEAREILRDLVDRGGEVLVARLAEDEDRLNVGITSLEITPELVSTGVPVEIRVTVENFSTRDAEGLDLSLRVDSDLRGAVGEAQLGEVVRVPAGATITRVVPYRFEEAGHHTVIAEIRSDGLVVDNRRYLVADVEDEVEVLLVDGEPAVDALDRETFYLQVALEPRDDSMTALASRVTPFLPEARSADLLADTDWQRYTVVILANVAELSRNERRGLERWVAEGGSLIVFLGSNVRPDVYNRIFGPQSAAPPARAANEDGDAAAATGEGPADRGSLLPFPLRELRGDEQAPVYLQVGDRSHPVTRFFEEHAETTDLLRSLIPFYYFIQAEEIDAEGRLPTGEPASPEGDASDGAPAFAGDARVLFRYSDLDQSPAVFDNRYGRGRVLWVTSSADQEWNELPVWRDFVVLLYQSIEYLVSFRRRADNLEVGELFERFYDPSDFASEVLVEAPGRPGDDMEGRRVVRRPMREVPDEKRFRVTYEDTQVAGLYRLDLRSFAAEPAGAKPAGGAGAGGTPDAPGSAGDSFASRVEYFAVNVDTEESRLASLRREDLSAHFGIEPVELDFGAKLRDLEREKLRLRGKEYWAWCLGAVLGLMFLETALAQFFGRRSR